MLYYCKSPGQSKGAEKGGTKTDLLPFARNVGAVEPDVQADVSARAKKMAVKAWV